MLVVGAMIGLVVGKMIGIVVSRVVVLKKKRVRSTVVFQALIYINSRLYVRMLEIA